VWFIALASTALAYDVTGSTWAAEDMPIPYWISGELGGGLDEAETVAAMQAAFDTWSAVDCAGVTFTYMGRAEGATFGALDGKNVVFLLDSGWPEEAGLLTTPFLQAGSGRMEEADLALNAQYFSWSTTEANGTSLFDVEAATAHEVGHLLGLWHTSVSGATLDPSYDGNPEARSLEQDDIDGLCALYPLIADGDGQLGEGCLESTDCAEGLFCLADGGARYCSMDCAEDSECGEGFACLEVDGGSGACALDVGEKEGCGCVTGGSPAGGLGLLFAAGALSLRRRWRAASRAEGPFDRLAVVGRMCSSPREWAIGSRSGPRPGWRPIPPDIAPGTRPPRE
jgi:MYXO-CTERM domain-containing protein